MSRQTPLRSATAQYREVKNIIKQLNSNILSKDQAKVQWSCNWRMKYYPLNESYHLNGKCLHQCMVYKAEVSTNIIYKEYYGMS